MATNGIVWGSTGNPSDLASRFSVAANKINGNVERMVRDMLREAVEEMEHSIRTRGVKNGIPNNQGRIKSEVMLKSVTYRLTYTRGGRVRGEFGYLNNAPAWALWQEYGTEGGQGNGRGILEMLALTDAYRNFRVKLENEIQSGRVLNFNQGQYSYRP